MSHQVKSKNQYKRKGRNRAIPTQDIVNALLATNNNRSEAARLLGCADATIRRRIAIDGLIAPAPGTLIDANLIQTAITKHKGNIRLVASQVQLSVSALQRRIKTNLGLRKHLKKIRDKDRKIRAHKNVSNTPKWGSKLYHTRAFGAATELSFSTRCIQHGFIPNKPQVDDLDYDIVVRGSSGYVHVQVKGRSTYNTQGGRGRCTVYCSFMNEWNLSKKGKPSDYTDIDVFAYWVAPADAWYLIPIDAIESVGVGVAPNGDGSGKYEQYKENWSIFK